MTVDRRKAITEQNLVFAFHHFDIDNTNFITVDNLEECFRREGKHLSSEELGEMLSQVKTAEPGKVTFDEFKAFMQEILQSESSPTSAGRLGR